ncbi:MAG: toprim domain-containing protein [Thermoplasmatota archaeon]
MDYKEGLDEVRDIIARVRSLNERIPILVEGEKDVAALRRLGVTGMILTVHAGRPLVDVCDRIAVAYDEIIILTDWDKKGGRLSRAIEKNLSGRTRCITEFRGQLAKNSMVKDIEGLPSYLDSMQQKIDGNER